MQSSRFAKSAFLAGAFAVTTMLASAPVYADVYKVIGQEDAVNGFTGPLFVGVAGYDVASDGESLFQPFGITVDVSDAIRLDNPFNWTQAADSKWTPSGHSTWYVPAADPGPGCGAENGNTCEMVGHSISAAPWDPSLLGTYVILSADGKTIGDTIKLSNTAAGAEILFVSDPVPEPSEWAMMALGLAGLGVFMQRRQNKA